MISAKVRAFVKDYCKRNGLLTLSVFAVVTGCVLGFVLRTYNLSTQVWINRYIEIRQWIFLTTIAYHYLGVIWCDGCITQHSGCEATASLLGSLIF